MIRTDNELFYALLAAALFLLLVVIAMALCYSIQRCLDSRTTSACWNEDCRPADPTVFGETDKEIIVFHDNIPIKLRLVMTPWGPHYRILDECHQIMLEANAHVASNSGRRKTYKEALMSQPPAPTGQDPRPPPYNPDCR